MRRIFAALALTICLTAGAHSAIAGPVLDCPLRDAPFSATTPLIDILLSPAARQVVERELGTSFASMPERFAGTTAPTFAAILTLREASGILRARPEGVANAIAALQRLPVTQQDKVARCARYDNEQPALNLPRGKRRVLLFEKMTGFRDGPSVDAAHAAFLALGKEQGIAVIATDKGGAINPETLRHFDAVIWNNVSGDVLTLTQRHALQRYVESGGGFLAVHGSAGDPVYFWDWYVDRLIGARFAGHPMNPQFQDATVRLEGAANPIANNLPREWKMNDEWYSFKTNPRAAGARVIATLDEATYKQIGTAGQDLRMGDHPIAWTNCVGRGRMFYSAIGHRPETYGTSEYRTMLSNALRWTMHRSPCLRSP